MITKYLDMTDDERNELIHGALKRNEEFLAEERTYLELIKKFGPEVSHQIDDEVIRIMTLAEDIIFDAGFNEGVKFIMGCLAGQEVSRVILMEEGVKA
ncbi:MAG: hypothetical protein ACM3XR_02170 [Bacillota bacterium]